MNTNQSGVIWACPSQLRRPKPYPTLEADVLRFVLFDELLPESGWIGSVDAAGSGRSRVERFISSTKRWLLFLIKLIAP